MTSQVKITAHCSDDKQVLISEYNPLNTPAVKNKLINNSETYELSVYDEKSVTIYEVLKGKKPE